jgi:hypothetical protein
MLSKKQKENLIRKGFDLLKANKGYSQSKVVQKLNHLGHKTNVTAFSNIKKEKPVSAEALIIVFQGMKELLEKEICHVISENAEWEKAIGCEEEIIQEDNKNDFTFHEGGRLKIEDKVDFLMTAKKEVIEFGMTLNTFSNYLLSRSEAAYKNHIIELLKKGVHYKCYLLDPNWSGTRSYFDDRESVCKEGDTGIDKIKSSLRRLKVISDELTELNTPGQFEVFTYRHFPSNSFLAIDIKDKSNSKMMVSNYLFGEKRADCPVMLFTRTDQLALFMRYLRSLNQIISKAKKVDFKNLPA